jgi:hypothetical protein
MIYQCFLLLLLFSRLIIGRAPVLGKKHVSDISNVACLESVLLCDTLTLWREDACRCTLDKIGACTSSPALCALADLLSRTSPKRLSHKGKKKYKIKWWTLPRTLVTKGGSEFEAYSLPDASRLGSSLMYASMFFCYLVGTTYEPWACFTFLCFKLLVHIGTQSLLPRSIQSTGTLLVLLPSRSLIKSYVLATTRCHYETYLKN